MIEMFLICGSAINHTVSAANTSSWYIMKHNEKNK